MAHPWFRRRRPEEGIGYTIASREGLAATLAFILVAALAVVVPLMVGGETFGSFLIGWCLLVACLAGFLAIVREHSDRPR